MPFIGVNTTKKLEKAQKDALKEGIGTLISILPGKTEQVTMIDISDGHTMYFSGEEKENCAYIDVRLYGSIGFEPKSEFTEAMFRLLEEVTGIGASEAYISYGEYTTWGTGGRLK